MRTGRRQPAYLDTVEGRTKGFPRQPKTPSAAVLVGAGTCLCCQEPAAEQGARSWHQLGCVRVLCCPCALAFASACAQTHVRTGAVPVRVHEHTRLRVKFGRATVTAVRSAALWDAAQCCRTVRRLVLTLTDGAFCSLACCTRLHVTYTPLFPRYLHPVA